MIIDVREMVHVRVAVSALFQRSLSLECLEPILLLQYLIVLLMWINIWLPLCQDVCYV